MSYTIVSPKNSFVDFNPPTIITCLDEPDISLPQYNDFGIQFQFQVQGDLPSTSQLRAVICDADGNKILDQGIFAQNLCYQYRLSAQESQFPITVNAGQPIPAGSYDYPSFLLALGNLIGTTIPSSQFDYCCLFPAITIATSIGNVTFGAFWDYGYVSYPQINMAGLLRLQDCFRYGIADANGNLLAFSNKFRRVADTCFSTLLSYWNDDDAFGFSYPSNTFFNTCRLPFTFHKPVYPIVEQVYTKSDGSIKRASSRINKEYEGYTDFLTEYYHEKLVVALKHDHVVFTNSDVGLNQQELFVEGDYKPEWPDDNTIVVAMAKLKISMPISDINSNCYSQVTLPCCPPYITGIVPTDSSFTVNVNFGMFTTAWNFQWRPAGDTQWMTVTGLTGKSYTISAIGSGLAIEYQLQSVCGSVTGPWSSTFSGSTSGSVAEPCTGTVTGITVTQEGVGEVSAAWTVSGDATQWYVTVDGQLPATKVMTPSINLTGLAAGNHVIAVQPICSGGATGTSVQQAFTVIGQPSLNLISASNTGPGGFSVNTFQVGASVAAGNRFVLVCYNHSLTIVAVAGDTSATIAQKLVQAVNDTTSAQWNSASGAPAPGTPGFPPTATTTGGGNFNINLNYSAEFIGAAFYS